MLQLLGGKSLNDLARETGRRRKQLAAWRRRFVQGGRAYLAGRDELSELQALREAHRELTTKSGELERENRRLATRVRAIEKRAEVRSEVRSQVHPICSQLYAEAFHESDTVPFHVPEWRTHVLIRNARKAMGSRVATGLQPHSSLDPDCDLAAGLRRLKEAAIASVTLITDPMWCADVRELTAAFATVRPFKENYFIDRDAGSVRIRKRHRNMVNNARRSCEVIRVALSEHLETWWSLYQLNVQNRGITQPLARTYFERIARLDELTTLAVVHEEEVVSMTLWLRFNEIVYYHDGASNPKGLALAASYAAFADAIERFEDCRYLFLGGSADFRRNDGLAVFKRGFANASAQSYICSSILNPRAQQDAKRS